VAEKLLLIPTFNLRWLLFDFDFIPFHYYFSDMIYLCERERGGIVGGGVRILGGGHYHVNW
jgi:hypothetical protein